MNKAFLFFATNISQKFVPAVALILTGSFLTRIKLESLYASSNILSTSTSSLSVAYTEIYIPLVSFI